MELFYDTVKAFGMDSFAVADYTEYLHDQGYEDEELNECQVYGINNFLAGAVIFDDDSNDSILAFINMAVEAKPQIIMIDFSHITAYDFKPEVISQFIEGLSDDEYFDMQSYELRICYGRKVKKLDKRRLTDRDMLAKWFDITSSRAGYNAVLGAGIRTIPQLAAAAESGELRKIRKIGPATYNKILRFLDAVKE